MKILSALFILAGIILVIFLFKIALPIIVGAFVWSVIVYAAGYVMGVSAHKR